MDPFASQIMVISSQNKVQKYHTKGHEQVYNPKHFFFQKYFLSNLYGKSNQNVSKAELLQLNQIPIPSLINFKADIV